MRVVATAGHVDHGKSTLVRALTGTEPDRWAEEQKRGLTIDLGYAHTTLPSGETVAFVDVPGHQRFIANMLAGLGPAPAVLLVIAADEGWRAQSSEHLAAIDALGLRHGLLVVTRSDLASPADALAQARTHLAGTSLEGCAEVVVSGVTGAGLDDLRVALDQLCAELPTPDPAGRARLWIDRSFTIKGSGTVVTGTLESGSLRTGEAVWVGGREIGVRQLQSLGSGVTEVASVARVAVNLRGVSADEVRRGAVLLTGPWHHTEAVDVRVPGGVELPEQLMLHVGTAALEARVRPLGGNQPSSEPQHVRLTWSGPLPLQVGDRLILRDPGRQQVLAGAVVLDADPPALTRRGAARARAQLLVAAPERIDLVREVERRGWVNVATLRQLGAALSQADAPAGPGPDSAEPRVVSANLARRGTPGGLGGERATGEAGASPAIVRVGDWCIAGAQWATWRDTLRATVAEHVRAHPLQGRMPMQAAVETLQLPDLALVPSLAQAAGLEVADGQLAPPGVRPDLGRAEAGLQQVEQRLAEHPFQAPERDELHALALGVPEIAVAVRLGRLIDLGDQIVLLPKAPALAMRELSGLPQPFTTSQARQALNTTRRVVIPLLEHLDRRGWTRRVDDRLREVRRR